VRQCREAEAKALRDEVALEAERLRAAEEEKLLRQVADGQTKILSSPLVACVA